MIHTGEVASWELWDNQVNILYYFIYSYLGPLSLLFVSGAITFLGLMQYKTARKMDQCTTFLGAVQLKIADVLKNNTDELNNNIVDLKKELTNTRKLWFPFSRP